MINNIKDLLDKNFLKISSLGIGIIDKELNFIMKNSTFETMFPYLKEFEVQEFSINLHSAEGNINFEDYFENPSEVTAYKYEFEKKNKVARWVIHIIPLLNEEKIAEYAVCIVKDLSDSNHWQKEFNILFEKVPNLIAVLDSEFNVIRANEKFRDAFGDTGTSIELYRKKHLENKNTPAYYSFLDGDEHFGAQVLITKGSDKSHFLVNSSPFAYNEKGEVTQVLEISTDITEINQLQEQLQHAHDFYAEIIENSADGIIAIGRKGKTQIFNESARKILNWNQQRKPGIPKIQEMLPKEFFDEPDEHGKILVNKELNVISADGITIPVRINAFELTNKKIYMGRVAFLQDLRPVKELEMQKIMAEKTAIVMSFKALEESMKSLVDVQEIALDNYEKAIESNGLLDKNLAWAYVRQRFNVVNKIVKSFINVINGYMPIYSEVNFSQIALKIISELNDISSFNDVKLINKIKPSDNKYLSDENAIKAIMIILLSNAIDEAAKTESNCMVIIEADEFSEHIFIKVTDNGPTISKQLMEKLFEIKDSNNARIGLVTVAMIAKALDGRIEVSSTNDDGNNFMVLLPAKRVIQ